MKIHSQIIAQYKTGNNTSRALPGFPCGWFAVGFSRELPSGGILSRQFMGQDLIVFRTTSGVVCTMDAFCPHMGAHFAYGGRVEGETIRCPFHGFCFDQRGDCVATGYGTKPPPTAKVRILPSCEVNGMILVYYDKSGQEPTWNVPGFDHTGWSSLATRSWTLRTHPQETTENSVDIGHLTWVHGYQSLDILTELVTEGPHLSVGYAMRRPAGLFGTSAGGLRAEFEIHVYGLGYSFVETRVPSYGLHSYSMVCATPLDSERIEMRVAMTIEPLIQPQHIHPFLLLLPKALVNKLISALAFKVFLHDIQQDFIIWENKRYIQPPVLAEGDGPIGKYRQWVRQFYPQQHQ